jgi:hypothetical protein
VQIFEYATYPSGAHPARPGATRNTSGGRRISIVAAAGAPTWPAGKTVDTPPTTSVSTRTATPSGVTTRAGRPGGPARCRLAREGNERCDAEDRDRADRDAPQAVEHAAPSDHVRR